MFKIVYAIIMTYEMMIKWVIKDIYIYKSPLRKYKQPQCIVRRFVFGIGTNNIGFPIFFYIIHFNFNR